MSGRHVHKFLLRNSLAVLFPRVRWLARLLAAILGHRGAAVLVSGRTAGTFPATFFPLSFTQHVLTPQIEEVFRVRVEGEAFSGVVAIWIKIVQRRRRITVFVLVHQRDGYGGSCHHLLVVCGR